MYFPCMSLIHNLLVWSMVAQQVLAHVSTQRLARRIPSLGRSFSAGVHCGQAFQPCCLSSGSCTGDTLVCVGRGANITMCEPCGDVFSQPCPARAYCSSESLIPTERADTSFSTCHVLPNSCMVREGMTRTPETRE
jgi:hypothetical protein